MGMCAANNASTFDFDFGYQTVPGLSCNVWHRPPVAPDFGGAGRPHEFGVIADSFCMSRNPYDRLSSQYRYKSTLDPEKFPPTCRAFGDFLDEHIDRMQDNALVRCLHKGAVSPSECQYHIRARLTREKELSMEEIDELSTYSDEDCHFLPQTMYTRACQNVFKLEEYETAVAPFLEKALHLPRGAASASEETRVLARLGAFRDANDVDEDDWKAEQDAAADAWRDARERVTASRERVTASPPRAATPPPRITIPRRAATSPRTRAPPWSTSPRTTVGTRRRRRRDAPSTSPPRTTESSPARGRSASRAPPSGIAPTARGGPPRPSTDAPRFPPRVRGPIFAPRRSRASSRRTPMISKSWGTRPRPPRAC